ncbi:RDD family protein [Pseudoxanthomonas sacheonensis]|uniref:RDD family membrane protein YckC n=1 Tax=Pseudoxanthomonas sacheonensis TaxID=443615 RepID=A0ABU1RVC9_9GAMM|nr:RDD family protein [Pseudoxanthomonas sacheonensis]MDR6842074.1 putative RDD family membrane protein YckC [Pseudoxanthomonas sacheonensis]
MSIWYYTDAERQQQGPLSTDELKQYFHREIVNPDTLVWRDGMLHWRALSELAGQLNLLPAAAVVTEAPSVAKVGPPALAPLPSPVVAEPEPALTIAPAPTSGRAVFNLGSEPSELPPQVLAEVRHRAHQALENVDSDNPYWPAQAALRSRRPATRDEDVVYAGFWKRTAAAIVDGILIWIIGSFGGEALGTLLGDLAGGSKLAVAMMVLLVTLTLQVCYYAFFHASFNAATPGKMLIGIKVVRGDGDNISFLRAVARYFATIPSGILLGIGYLMAGFTARKQALHDMICDTVVVDKWAFTGQPEMQRHELGTATVVVLVGYVGLIVLAVIFVAALGFGDAVRHVR